MTDDAAARTPDTTTTETSPEPKGNGKTANIVATGTSLFTLSVKIIGLGMAAREAFFVDPPRDAVVLALAAFMMAGAQGIDSFIGNILGKK